MMTRVTRTPLFWIAFAALSALSALFAWEYFTQALPLINRKVPENASGPALETTRARAIAEARAKVDWAIDLAPYRLLEQSQVQRPNGRVDHTFVYERERETLGDGRFRLRLTVSGDALTEVAHTVHIPEAFDRRYQELSSANN